MKELMLVKKEVVVKKGYNFLLYLFMSLIVIGVSSAGVVYFLNQSTKINVSYPFIVYEGGNRLSSGVSEISLYGGESVERNITVVNPSKENQSHRLGIIIYRLDGEVIPFNDTKIVLTDVTHNRVFESSDSNLLDEFVIPSNSNLTYTLFYQLRNTILNGTYYLNLSSSGGVFVYKK